MHNKPLHVKLYRHIALPMHICSRNGKGQQACYDEEGNLLPFERGGGTVDKVHVKENGHFLVDVLPYLYCCSFSYGNCDKYGEMRPTQGCENYNPPGSGNKFSYLNSS